MTDEQRPITDNLLLSELTVGEFKKLIAELLSSSEPVISQETTELPETNITVRRKSLDEFMNDLGE
ncbi:MAG: hypothetical protein Phog2KO_17320 [Phototrophicaceae bacterium]